METKEIFDKLPTVLFHLTQKYFDGFVVRLKYNKSNTELNIILTEDGYNVSKTTSYFQKISFHKKPHDIYHVRLETNYTNNDIFVKAKRFEEYIYYIVEKVAFMNNSNHYIVDVNFFVRNINMEKLFELLSVTYLIAEKFNI